MINVLELFVNYYFLVSLDRLWWIRMFYYDNCL